MQEEKIHNAPHMSKEGWKYLISRLPEIADFSRYNNADTNQYVRLPTDAPLL